MQSTALRHLLPANFKSPCSACPGPQLEEGNAALLHEAAPLLDLLAADALSAHPAQATSALTALCTVLAADPTGGSADELYRTSLPARILSDLQEGPHRALTQPPPRGQEQTGGSTPAAGVTTTTQGPGSREAGTCSRA